MRPISQMSDETAAGITALFCDIDDTLTTGVVGENGEFCFAYYEIARKVRHKFAVPEGIRATDRVRLLAVAERILREVPGTAVSADPLYREAVVTIEFCKDVPTLIQADIERIKVISEEEGAVARVSSIHVNGWYGDCDQLTLSLHFASAVLGIDIASPRHRVAFVGDSQIDAPMFAYFPQSCGVANVLHFKGRTEADPIWVTKGEGGQGFVEAAERPLSVGRKVFEDDVKAGSIPVWNGV